ncbi:MAG: TIGR01777 family protein [Bacteroidetes bacterium]|nr:TIGR01777 family protein [Bacteroidota bacterium]MBI3482075.1 TIGR01777 family protein [Bacteroidota bacterium]
MAKIILITGATGLIGSRLSEMLSKNHSIVQLGRSKREGKISSFVWDISKSEIDLNAFDEVDTIVHLSGASVGDKRWTVSWKKEILDSRVQSTKLLFDTLTENKHSVKTFVSASAIGYYGFECDSIFEEQGDSGKDFLAQVTKRWEDEVDKVSSLGIRVVKIRIGIVLSAKGGALKKMVLPIKCGIGSPLGSGQQYLSWIHIDDLCGIFVKAIEDEKMDGAYNAVTDWVTNEGMTKAIAKILKRHLWLPKVPSFALKVILGEMADIVLNGSKVSSEKIRQAGFRFQYPVLEDALKNLLG